MNTRNEIKWWLSIDPETVVNVWLTTGRDMGCTLPVPEHRKDRHSMTIRRAVAQYRERRGWEYNPDVVHMDGILPDGQLINEHQMVAICDSTTPPPTAPPVGPKGRHEGP